MTELKQASGNYNTRNKIYWKLSHTLLSAFLLPSGKLVYLKHLKYHFRVNLLLVLCCWEWRGDEDCLQDIWIDISKALLLQHFRLVSPPLWISEIFVPPTSQFQSLFALRWELQQLPAYKLHLTMSLWVSGKDRNTYPWHPLIYWSLLILWT